MLYVPMHKCLRSALASVSLHCGNADFDDAANVDAVRSELLDVVRMVRHHAQNEHEFLHPLYGAIGHSFDDLESQHRDSEAQLDALERLIEKIRSAPVGSPERAQAGGELYRRVNLFMSSYFVHLDEEEHRFLPVLMQRMAHEKILDARRRLQESVPRDMLLLYLKYQIKTLNPNERLNVMREYRRVQPDAFDEMCRIAEAALPPAEWASLGARLRET